MRWIASQFDLNTKPADHDLEPSGGRDGLERREATRRHVGELEVLRHRQVARHADAGLDGDHVEEAKHRRPPVLDLLAWNELYSSPDEL